jgi:predicted MFS family arabinose efflux permease
LLGGFFVDTLSWRWVFYINLPIGLAALFVTATVLDLPFRRVEHPVDYLGAGLLVSGVTSLLLVMVWGGSEYPWGSPMVIGLSALTVALIGLFLLQERRAAEPILPLRLFRDRTFAITSAAGFIVGLGMFGGIVFLPLFLQVVMGATPTNSGLLLLPLMGGVVVSSIVSGRLITRTGRYKIYPLVGTTLMAIGLWLFSTMSTDTALVTASIFMLIFGTGIGLVLQVLVIAVQNAVEARDLGVATSSAQFFRSLGGSFGTALFGAVLTSQLAIRLATLLPAGAEMGELTGSPDLIAQLPAGTRESVMDAFSGAITMSFAIAVPFALAALLLVVFLPELPLRDTAHVGAGESDTPVAPGAIGH